MALPPSLKKIVPYINISKQFKQRDPLVSYYVTMYALQEGMAEAKEDAAGKGYLFTLLDDLEQMKHLLKGDPNYAESITNDVVGRCHVETAALKLFDFADSKDRSGVFNKAVIKTFYTASHILSSLKQFGEVDEEIEKKTKYAKWKAVEIDRCLKAGITPTPGPPVQENDDLEGDNFGGPSMPQPNFGGGAPSDPGPSTSGYYPPPNQDRPVPMPRTNIPHSSISSDPPAPSMSSYPPGPSMTPSSSAPYPPYPNTGGGGSLYPGTGSGNSPGEATGRPSSGASGSSSYNSASVPTASGGSGSKGKGVTLGPEQMTKAQKYCKFAASALDYDDSSGAIDYLNKALTLLQTGKDN